MLSHLCLLIGGLICLFALIWSAVVAFRQSIWWLLGCWFVPFVGLIFLIKFWSEAKRPFLLYLAGVGVMLPAFIGFFQNPASAGALAAALRKGTVPALTTITSPNGTPRATAAEGAGGSLAQELQGVGVGRFQDGRWQPVAPGALGSKKVFAFYYSAHWCPPCRTFTPKLVAFYRDFAASHPDFELVFVSADHSEGEMRGYMQEAGMPWPAVPFNKAGSANLPRSAGNGIPCLVLADANGRVLSDSYAGSGTYLGPQKVLDDLSKFPAGSGSGGNPGPILAANPPLTKGETSPALRRELAATETAERRAALLAERQAAYGKHRAEADALYTDLNARRLKLKVDDARLVAAFNADAARYGALLEQVRTEKLAVDELTFGANPAPPPAAAVPAPDAVAAAKPGAGGAKGFQLAGNRMPPAGR